MAEETIGRRILEWPVGSDGYFEVPAKRLTIEEEEKAHEIRCFASTIAQYADSSSGCPSTLDQTGAYLCGGRADRTSKPCNLFVILGSECLIRERKTVSQPHNSSCAFWEVSSAGDPEARRCPAGRYDDERIKFGTTRNPLGFSCERCEYGEGKMKAPDSEGRARWCKKHGMPVFDEACCADNDPGKGNNDGKRKAAIFAGSNGGS